MDFSESVQQLTQYSGVCLITHLARELGIFDVLQASNAPLSSQQVADSKKLKERYVREILGCLTSFNLVQISEDSSKEILYYVKEEAKEAIGKGALAGTSVTMAVASAYPQVKSCCQVNGPPGMEGYDEFVYQFLDDLSHCSYQKTTSDFLRNVPELEEKLNTGLNVFEFGSGTGHLISELARRFPNSSFTASEMTDALADKIRKSYGHIPNLKIETIDICEMKDFPSTKFDWIFASIVVHDLPYPLAALKNVRQMIKEDGGWLTFYDMAGPGNQRVTAGVKDAAIYYALSATLCIPASFQTRGSEAHGATWARATLLDYLDQAGFEVTVDSLSDYEANFVCKPK